MRIKWRWSEFPRKFIKPLIGISFPKVRFTSGNHILASGRRKNAWKKSTKCPVRKEFPVSLAHWISNDDRVNGDLSFSSIPYNMPSFECESSPAPDENNLACGPAKT
jgi:hypothetical protein